MKITYRSTNQYDSIFLKTYAEQKKTTDWDF